MSCPKRAYTVFTKPWKMPLADLGRFVRNLGFDGVELPVRSGFPVTPETVADGLPAAARTLGEFGLRIGSVAAEATEPVIAACGEAGVPIVRICVPIPPEKDYLTAIEDFQRQWDALVPALDRSGVALGIQNHCNRFITHAMHLHHAIGRYDPKHVCAVWDAAHNALQGEDVELALDVVWSHLRLVNLKNAYWRRVNGPEAEAARWKHYWTSGRHGLADWARVARALARRGYRGDLCLTAEYSDASVVDRLIAEDLAYARTLFGTAPSG